jgi:hypothetical protein
MRTCNRGCVTQPDCGVTLLKLMHYVRRNTASTGYKPEVLLHLSEHVGSPVREQQDGFFRVSFDFLHLNSFTFRSVHTLIAVTSSIGLWGLLQNPKYLRIFELLRKIEGVEASLVLDAGIGVSCDQQLDHRCASELHGIHECSRSVYVRAVDLCAVVEEDGDTFVIALGQIYDSRVCNRCSCDWKAARLLRGGLTVVAGLSI